MMKFSVVIPLYNKAPHIKDTINSVLAQTFTDYEIIVVDDGSTDGGGEIVAALNDARINLIRQENAGVSAARNKGIALSQGAFIAFLDADDLWLSHHLETLNQLIQIYPDCGMYGSAYHVINDHRKYSKNHLKNKPPGWHTRLNFEGYLDFVLEQSPFWTGITCIRKSLFREVGLFEVGMVRGQDQDMWLRTAAQTPVAFINTVTAIYNQNAVNRSPERWSPEWNEGLSRHASMMNCNAFSPSEQKKLYEYYAKRMISRGREALTHRCQREAFFCLTQCYKTRKFRVAFAKLLIKYLISYVHLPIQTQTS